MITPSHMIYSWVFAKATDQRPNKLRTVALVAGGLVPDIPTYAFFCVHTFLIGSAQTDMWSIYYFDSAWSPFITLSHSLLLWPVLLLFATITKRTLLKFFSASALFHITLDFFVHHDDAYRHFWPLSDWQFSSPLSYYDPLYYGNLVSSFDSILIISLLLWLGTVYTNKKARFGILVIVLLYLAALVVSYIL